MPVLLSSTKNKDKKDKGFVRMLKSVGKKKYH